jgi:hypothetical protein
VEYGDNKTVVIKFRRGLDPTLQNQVALLGDGAQDFDDPEGWYKAARKVARNREANEAFVETSRWTPRSSTCSAPTPIRPGSTFALIRRQLLSFAPPPPVCSAVVRQLSVVEVTLKDDEVCLRKM